MEWEMGMLILAEIDNGEVIIAQCPLPTGGWGWVMGFYGLFNMGAPCNG